MNESVPRSQLYVSRRQMLGLGAGLTAAGLLAACSKSSSSLSATSSVAPNHGKPKVGGSLEYSGIFDVATLDPAFSSHYSERFIYYAVYNGLVTYDEKLNIVPDLATGWTYSDGGKTLTFKLRPGVVFHDGTACDAAAVKYNLDRVLDPDTESPQRAQLTPPLESVEAPDSTTVVLKLSQPWRPLLAALGERPGFIVSPTALKKYGKDYGAHAVGTGPFKVTDYQQGDHIVLTRFEKNWNAKTSYLNSVRFDNVPNAASQITRLKTGEASIVYNIDPTLLATLKGASGVSAITNTTGTWYVSTMNYKSSPFQDENLRHAIAYATDREAIVQAVFQKKARQATTPIGAGWAYDANYNGPTYTYNIDNAKAALAKAANPHVAIPFVNSTNSQYTAVSQAMLNGFKKAGLNVKSSSVPADSFFSEVKAGKILWSIGSWAPRADPDGLLRILFHTDGAQNTAAYSNPQVDNLLDQAAQISDHAKAFPMYEQVYDLINADAVLQSVIWPDNVIAFRSQVNGVKQYGDGILRFKDMWMS
jgi:peptide/nickel transport system substrate-binding protein